MDVRGKPRIVLVLGFRCGSRLTTPTGEVRGCPSTSYNKVRCMFG